MNLTQPAIPGAYSAAASPGAMLRDDSRTSPLIRLRDNVTDNRTIGWLVTMVITGVAFLVRLVNLGYPGYLVFDETFYAKDGYTLWRFGFETNWPETADESIRNGFPDVYYNSAEFVVHPPVGKWLIGFGEHLFGMNAFGWRFMPLIFGSALVFVTIRLARRVSRSNLVGAMAGVLLTFDGLAFTMSRLALLDIFQAFFLVAAVSCVVADRDWYRTRLADAMESRGLPTLAGTFGPRIWWRPWRWAAGLMFGLAIGTKWNSIFVLAALGILSVVWDLSARRLAGARWSTASGLLFDGVPAFVAMVVWAALVYVATWTGWFVTAGGYDRRWGALNPTHPWVRKFGADLASFGHLHREIYEWHTGEFINTATHPWEAHPAGWLFMVRPILVDVVYEIRSGVEGCQAAVGSTCLRTIWATGTPVLWWLAAAALVLGLIWWIDGADWRFGVPVLAALSVYLPWFRYAERPLFFFYAVTIIPFTVVNLAMVLGWLLGPANSPQRQWRGTMVGVAVGLVVMNFAFIYPILTDQLLPSSHWLVRMWFDL